jgi:hypothetical protein
MRAGRPSLVVSQSNTGKELDLATVTETRKPAVAHAGGLRGGAAAFLSSHHPRLLSYDGNSKIAASATAMIGRRSKTVKHGLVLSPLSTATSRLQSGRRSSRYATEKAQHFLWKKPMLAISY